MRRGGKLSAGMVRLCIELGLRYGLYVRGGA